ncbi:MAG: DUF3341 domain-containing protein [Deltaproteobacteria bacterium]|nr:DUF3341 domain-containing protein [Deltaproteobacteria bacterium]
MAQNNANSKKLSGVVGIFDEPRALIMATKKAREFGFKHFDAFTPYPVHGLEVAAGLKRSPIPYVTFVFGLVGCVLAFLYQYWTSAIDWALNIGGKPYNSWPAFVPIMFEVTILLGGLSTAAALFIFCGLPNLKKKAFDLSITRDRFALMIETPNLATNLDVKDNLKKTKEFLQSVGAKEVREVYEEGWGFSL